MYSFISTLINFKQKHLHDIYYVFLNFERWAAFSKLMNNISYPNLVTELDFYHFVFYDSLNTWHTVPELYENMCCLPAHFPRVL